MLSSSGIPDRELHKHEYKVWEGCNEYDVDQHEETYLQ